MNIATGPTERRVSGIGGELCCFEWGRAGDPDLLLLHATSFHARCWDQVVAALPSPWHVIAVDLPGHGRSYRPSGLQDWNAIAAEIAALVETLGLEQVTGAGHSLGGYVMMDTAAICPDRFRQLVLIEPVALAPAEYHRAEGPKFADLTDHPIARRRSRWDSPEQMEASFRTRLPYRLFDPLVLRDYCRHGLVPGDDGFDLACLPRIEVSAYGGTKDHDPYRISPSVRVPTTIIRGGDHDAGDGLDFLSSTTWDGFAATFPAGRDIHLPHLTHLMPMEEPGTIARLIATA